MTGREVIGRYRGSVMGLAWSFLHPVFMLAVYTFVFSVVFQTRWGNGTADNRLHFALAVFVGMIVDSLFADVLNRAAMLIPNHVNYVKKVIFPLEILPVVTMGATVFHTCTNLIVLLTAALLFNGYLHWTVVFVPIVLFPLVMLTLGMAWIMASVGVFLRDLGQTIGMVTTTMLFLSPVFYPMTALPESIQPWFMANPLTFIIEQARDTVILGHVPNWNGLVVYTTAASIVCWAGYAWFQKTRRMFADVI